MTAWYRFGTASVNSGVTTVTLSVGATALNSIREGDALVIGLFNPVEIAAVTDNNTIELRSAWPNASQSGAAYAIIPGPAWDSTASLALEVSEYLSAISGIINSTTTLTLGIGTKTLQVPANLRLSVGAYVRLADTANPTTKFMAGTVTGYAGTTLTVEVDRVEGTGDVSSWNINLTGSTGPQGLQGPQGIQGIQGEPGIQGIQGEQGLQGPQGIQGIQGDAGPAGVSGTSALTRVRVVATANVDIATALEAGDTVDGVTLAQNDLVLLTGQTAPAENGVYVVPVSGAASRHVDFDAYDELPGTYFSIMEGTAKEDTLWRCTSDRGGTLGTTAIAISEFVGGGSGGGGGRELLTAARTYYVDGTLGNDSNDGLSSGAGAFATIQKAVDTTASLDLSIYDVTISVANGTYAEAVVLKHLVGAGSCYIVGDEVTPSNVVVSPAAGNSFSAQSIFSIYYLRGMKMAPASGCVSCAGPSKIFVRNLNFGAAVVHLTTQPGGIIEADGDYTISGSATYHWLSSGMIDVRARTITLTGTPAFGTTASAGFASAIRGGGIVCFSNTFSGSATGRRYFASGNGFIDTNGAATTYLPGDVAGVTSTGGQYV